jgi:hypothetical protein
MNKSMKVLVTNACLAGLLAGTTVRLHAQSTGQTGDDGGNKGAQTSDDSKHVKEKHSCKGQNSCKGKGGCKAGDNGCKGQNSCKGKGGCRTDGKKADDSKKM